MGALHSSGLAGGTILYTQCLICLVCVSAQVWVGIPFWYTSALRENIQNGATLEVQPSLHCTVSNSLPHDG